MSKFVLVPNEILLRIFGDRSLSIEDLISLSRVCRRFTTISDYDELWKGKFQHRWHLAWRKTLCGKIKILGLENWRTEVKFAIRITNMLEKILRSASHESYKFKSITSTVINSVYDMLNVVKFGHIFVLNELYEILYYGREADLTTKHYANQILCYVYHYIVKQEFEEFFSLSLEKQTFEKLAYYFGKGLQPKEFFDLDYEEISLKLDNLAIEVQSYLRTKNMNHPAVYIELFSPDEPLKDSKWSDEECEELFECILHIMLKKHNLKVTFGNIKGFYLSEILEKEEYDYFNEYIYKFVHKAICHRLGILLIIDEICRLIWKAPISGNLKMLEIFSYDAYEDVDESFGNLLCLGERSFKEISPLEMLQIVSVNYLSTLTEERTKKFDLVEDWNFVAGTVLILDSFNNDISYFVHNRDLLDCCLEYELYVETIKEILGKKSIRFRRKYKKSQSLLSIHRNVSKSFKPKHRNKDDNVIFATGMIVFHKITKAMGVIVGWDKECKSPKKVQSLECKEKKTFYNVLFSNNYDDFVEQEKLVLAKKPVQIKHHYDIGKYFREFNGDFYVPNEEMCSEYPDDEKFRTNYFKNL